MTPGFADDDCFLPSRIPRGPRLRPLTVAVWLAIIAAATVVLTAT